MKKRLLLYIACMLLLLPGIYGKLDIDDIRAFVNNERVSGVDIDGGDIKLNSNDLLEMTVKTINNEGNITQVKLKGVIQDIDAGSDLKKEFNWYDVEANGDRAKTLSFTMPSNAEKGTYDMELTVYWKYFNATESSDTIDYQVIILETASTTPDKIDLQSSFNNLTQKFGIMTDKMDSCFGYINNTSGCKDELSTCKEERGGYKSNYETTTNSLNTCNSDKTNFKTEKETCLNDKGSMKTTIQCNAEIENARMEGKSEAQKFFLIIAIVVGGIIGLIQWKKKQSTVTGAYFQKGIM